MPATNDATLGGDLAAAEKIFPVGEEQMICYASNTGTRANIEALRRNDWRILLTPANPVAREGLRFAIDNGAWSCYQSGTKFASAAFLKLVEQHGSAADFVILPDIVAGGMKSLEFSESWVRTLAPLKLLLLPIQDGMTEQAVGAFLSRHWNCGLFLGGTTEFKLKTMYGWGMVARSWARWYHIGRVNTRRRMRLCIEAGAHSCDGTSATRFSKTVPLLEAARRQPNLYASVKRRA